MVELAYALISLAIQDTKLASLCEQAVALLKRVSVFGRRLSMDKMAEALSLDFDKHQRVWKSVWLT